MRTFVRIGAFVALAVLVVSLAAQLTTVASACVACYQGCVQSGSGYYNCEDYTYPGQQCVAWTSGCPGRYGEPGDGIYPEYPNP